MLFKPLNIWHLVTSDEADNTVSKYVNIIPYLVDILIIPNCADPPSVKQFKLQSLFNRSIPSLTKIHA